MSVEDKIKELLEASQQEVSEKATAPGTGGAKAEPMKKAEGEVEDLGKAVTDPKEKSGPDAGKKVKKAAAPGGEANKGEQKVKPGATPVKAEETEADEDLEAIEETIADEDTEVLDEKKHGDEKKVIKAMKHSKKDMDEEDDEDEDEDDDDKEKEMDEKEDEMSDKEQKEMDDMKGKMINAMKMMNTPEGMKKLKAAYGMMQKAGYGESVDMTDDVNALTEGEDLSDEFKAKAKTIFESAVNSKFAEKIGELEEHYQNQIDEEVAKVQEDLTDKVDTYLSYVVEQWTKDNELAIERGLKSEITEDFIVSLKKVFEEHYIDVPEEKYDLVNEQQDKITELENKLNEEISKNAESMKEVNARKKVSKLEEASKDLTDTQKEKFASLVESVEYKDDETFEKELETLKESYFPKVAKPIEEDQVAVDEQSETVNVTGEMKDYVSAISRTIK